MFGLFKKEKNKSEESETIEKQSDDYTFKWYDIGEDNPFNKKILDCRSLTETLLSFTTDKAVAESFNQQRQSIGKEFIGFEFADPKTLNVNLVYPHNGSKIEGAGYKAQCMEDKWDIYAWNNVIYFVRSWTGVVFYKAFITITEDSFTIYKIEYQSDAFNEENPSLVENNIHFLILTLTFNRIFPHKVPHDFKTDKDIALYSFSQFGRNCWYATYENVIDTIVATKEK